MAGVARLLIIAGSDSGGGAGIQADIKAASARGVYAATAITAITAQNTLGVQQVHMLDPDLVGAQITAVLSDIGADAVKIGMLGTASVIGAVATALKGYDGPVVLDPVMVSKSGHALLDNDAVAALQCRLLPRATLLTPNLPEAARLLETTMAVAPAEVIAQGRALLGAGALAVLMKGGHADGAVCTDRLVTHGNVDDFAGPRIDSGNTHGTGCSLSSAIAAELAKGADLRDSVLAAHGWLRGALHAADRLMIGAGHGPVHHFHEVWP